MNDSITLGSGQPITANIPKQIPDYAFGPTVNPLIMKELNKPKPFSTKGMVGTARGLYGIANLSKEYAKAEKDGTHRFMISNDEYMSRQTGIPEDRYRKFRQATNNARLSMGLYRPLALQPDLLAIKTKLPDNNGIGSHYMPGTVFDRNDPDLTYTYVGYRPTKAEAEFGKQFKNLPYSDLLYKAVSNGLSEYDALGKSTETSPDKGVQLLLSYLPTSIHKPRTTINIMETLKHEIAHANAAPYKFGDVLKYPQYADAEPTDNADIDAIRSSNYNHGSPKFSFRLDTYFRDKPAEAWGAANRVKNDGAGLFYAKYGRLPGMDEYDNPLSDELKLKDIDELVDLFYDHNPGDLTLEYNRIYNSASGRDALTKKKVMKRWFKLRPVTEYPTEDNYDLDKHTDIFNFDLARNNDSYQNVKMANINGLVKAASTRQDTKQLDKLLKLIVNEYKKEGYDLSNMKAKFSDTPVYNNGKKVPAGVIDPNSVGGSWTNKGIVYINPNRKGPMEYYGKNVTKDPEEFSRLIMAHELAHEIYRNHADDAYKDKIRKAIKDEGFTTAYLDNGVSQDKMDEEGFAEYMANMVKNRMSDKDKLEAALDTSVSNSLIKASGKIMKVRVSNMEYAKDSLAMRCMWPRYVYMPDCEKYRNIVNGSSKSAKAKLAQKFWLNLPDSVKFAACDLVVVE